MSFWCLQFSQKMNENNSTWGTIVVKWIFLFNFLGELKIPKRHCEIKWSLVCTWYFLILRHNIVLKSSQIFRCQGGSIRIKWQRNLWLIQSLKWCECNLVFVDKMCTIASSNKSLISGMIWMSQHRSGVTGAYLTPEWLLE